MHKIQLSFEQVLEFCILGIKNENYDAAINLIEDLLKEIRTNPKMISLRKPENNTNAT